MYFKGLSNKADHIGITASTLCAIHCAVVPVLLTAVPLSGLGFLANPWFEWGMITLALFIGFYAVGSAYFIHHRTLPMIWLVAGFVVIAAGHLFTHGWLEAVIVPVGGLLIAFAHFLNNKYLGQCRGKHSVFNL